MIGLPDSIPGGAFCFQCFSVFVLTLETVYYMVLVFLLFFQPKKIISWYIAADSIPFFGLCVE